MPLCNPRPYSITKVLSKNLGSGFFLAFRICFQFYNVYGKVVVDIDIPEYGRNPELLVDVVFVLVHRYSKVEMVIIT